MERRDEKYFLLSQHHQCLAPMQLQGNSDKAEGCGHFLHV